MGIFIILIKQGEFIGMKSFIRYIQSKQSELLNFLRAMPPHSIGADPRIHQKSTETLYKFAGNPINICG